jgi:hypothetical protein
MDSMMMVIPLYVTLVKPNVLNVPDLSDVLNVKLGEKPDLNPLVHVKMVGMKTMPSPLPVPLVILNVTLVVQLTAMDVALVLLTEKITHQPVLVKTDITKMLLEFVNLVMPRDVKLVPNLNTIVIPVKLTELTLHQLAHVMMVIMKIPTTIVYLVTTLVPPVTQIVTDVALALVSESMLQLVNVQMDTMKIPLDLVSLVLPNV